MRILMFPAVVLLFFSTSSAGEKIAGFIYLAEAEHTTLTGTSWVQDDPASGGKSVSFQNQPITWTAITASGTYRLLVRVRAGYAGDHTFYVKPNADYAATVDGEKRPFTLLPDTLAYHGDEANFVWLTTEPFSLSQGMHTLLISAGPTYAKLDALGLTEDPEFVPPAAPPFGKETPNDPRLLPDDEQRQAYRGYTVWTRLAEQNVTPTDRPDDVMGVDALELAAAGNEYEAANLIVTNWQDTALTLRLQVSDLVAGKEGPRLSGQRFELLEAIPLPAFDGRWLADPLPLLASGVWTVPPRESRQIWLRLHAEGLQPGTYTGELTIDPVSASDQRLLRRLNFTVTIHPFSLPPRHPLFVFLNEYDLDFPGARADLAAHYVNVFHVCKIPGPDGVPDFTAHDAEVRSELQYAPQINFEHWWFRDRSDWKTAEGRARWQQWSRTWATHLWDDLGLTPDRVWLHIYDEQGGAAVDDYIAARRLLEEVTPAVQDVVTVASWTTLEEVRRMNPYVDIWSPLLGRLDSAGEVAFYQQSGKPVVPYICAENKKVFDPYESFRLMPWKIWRWGFHGCWIWTYLRGNAWNGREWDGGMVYPGQGGIVTSRRWELFRDGLEDYLYLYLLRQRIDAGSAPAGAAELLQQATMEVLAEPKAPERAHLWRTRLAAALSR